MASYLRPRSLRALALSSGVRGVAGARDPVIGWRRLRSASLRLGVGRPLAASAAERGCLTSAGLSGLCAPGESWDVPSVAPALRRRNTGSSLSGGTGGSSPRSQQSLASGGLAP